MARVFHVAFATRWIPSVVLVPLTLTLAPVAQGQVTGQAELQVSTIDSPDPATTGDDVTYTVTVANASSDTTATSVALTDTIPATTTFVSASTGCTEQSGVVTCDVVDLPPGDSAAPVDITVTTSDAGTITNSAMASASEDPDGDADVEDTTVEDPPPPPTADLRVTMTGAPATAVKGASATYTVAVHNEGPDGATGVTLTDTLPAGARDVTATPTAGTCAPPSDGRIVCSLGSISNGANEGVEIHLTLDASGQITNQAEADADEDDPDTANNSASQSTQVFNCTQIGTPGNDTITGTPGNDVLCGLDGNDTLIGLGGNDRLDGGPSGNDTLDGGDGNDQLFGRADDDAYRGGAGSDLARFDSSSARVSASLATGIARGEGNDTLGGIEGIIGSAKNDTLTGNGRDNDLYGRGGDDKIRGGDGFDYARYDFAGTTVAVSLRAGTASGGDGADTLGAIEGVVGSVHADVLTGNDGSNRFVGGAGDDAIRGRRRFDYTIYDFATGPMVVNLASGTSSGPDGGDTLSAIEGILGSPFDDQLTGDAGANTIGGRTGHDRIIGGDGADSLFGDEGNDDLLGQAAADFLSGGPGNDDLNGGAGTDRCLQDGGSGRSVSCELGRR
jgi:uncharacterized repeat protein (TIGR01451 family)